METPFSLGNARVSPDGRWLAYQSMESGQDEVFVRKLRGPTGKTLISMAGGTEPRWSHNGTELFYRSGDRSMRVPVETGALPRFGRPAPLLELPS